MMNWTTAKLARLVELETGKREKGGARVDGGVPSIGGEHISDRGTVDLTSVRTFISEEFYNAMKQGRLKSGDVLLVKDGATTGKPGWLRDRLTTKAAVNEHVFVLRALPEGKLDNGFLFYALCAARAQRQLAAKYHGLIGGVNRSDVLDLDISFPRLDEQRRITAVLLAAQRGVELQERLIASTAELKGALSHKLFTEGIRGEPLKHTETGPVPESWVLVRLRDLLAIKHGYAFDGAYFRPQGERVLMTPGHFDENGGFRDQGERTKYYVGQVPPGYTLAPNDLLVAMTEQKAGLLGSAALVPSVGTYLHNQRLGLVTSLNETRLTKDYLYYFFNRPEIKSLVSAGATGSKVRHTSPGRLLDLIIALPTVAEQGAISRALQKVDAKQRVHLRRRDTLTSLFRTLLQQLMTAQICVDDVECSLFRDADQVAVGGA